MEVSEAAAALLDLYVQSVTCPECKYMLESPTTCACGVSRCAMCVPAPTSPNSIVGSLSSPCSCTSFARNSVLERRLQHLRTLVAQYQLAFHYKKNILPDRPSQDIQPVLNWLENSQNKFSAPFIESETTESFPIDHLTKTKPQIHSEKKKSNVINKVAYCNDGRQPLQLDWDKIEVLSTTKEIITQQQGEYDKIVNDDEHGNVNIRRSARKRILKSDDLLEKPAKKLNQKNYVTNLDKETNQKVKCNWKNVKKMRKEFSKLNKINKSKLNVSIEMYKKAKISAPTPTAESSPCVIEETPMIIDNDIATIGQNIENDQNSGNVRNNVIENNTVVTLGQIRRHVYVNDTVGATIEQTNNANARIPFLLKGKVNSNCEFNRQNNKIVVDSRVPFFYAGKLQRQGFQEKSMKIENTSNEGNNPDDIVITIRTGSTMTNVIINKKKQISVKTSIDREVQTSLPSVESQTDQDLTDWSKEKNTSSTQQKDNFSVECNSLSIYESTTKNAAGQVKSNDIIDKDLLKDINVCQQSQTTAQSLKHNNSKSIQNNDVQCLADSEVFTESIVSKTPPLLSKKKLTTSEILSSSTNTLQTCYVNNDRHSEQVLEKTMTHTEDIPIMGDMNAAKSIAYDSVHANYDEVMPQVFANIDADMEPQPIGSGNLAGSSESTAKPILQSQTDLIISQTIGKVAENKNSENIFSIVDKNDLHVLSIESVVEQPQTPQRIDDDPDSEGIVEETPQKKKRSVINITDTLQDSVLCEPDQCMDTPLTIDRFASRVQHRSTPVAEVARRGGGGGGGVARRVVGGSCLAAAQARRLRALSEARGWRFEERPSALLTHLVVAADHRNRAQRSVKYMVAVSAGAWVLSWRWALAALAALEAGGGVPEESEFEVLDWSGEEGPRRARLTRERGGPKLFEGLTFICHPPYSVLDQETLQTMLELAGGRVLSREEGVRERGKGEAPIVLLEPQHHEGDAIVYLALAVGGVALAAEWALGSLGAHAVGAVGGVGAVGAEGEVGAVGGSQGSDLLMPEELLPPAAALPPLLRLAMAAASPIDASL